MGGSKGFSVHILHNHAAFNNFHIEWTLQKKQNLIQNDRRNTITWNLPQWWGPLTSKNDFRCAVKGVILLNTKSSNEWAHRKFSSLVRGPNHCGGFCRRVAGLFKESNSLFHDSKPFSSADSSLFMVHNPQKNGTVLKCAKNSNLTRHTQCTNTSLAP